MQPLPVFVRFKRPDRQELCDFCQLLASHRQRFLSTTPYLFESLHEISLRGLNCGFCKQVHRLFHNMLVDRNHATEPQAWITRKIRVGGEERCMYWKSLFPVYEFALSTGNEMSARDMTNMSLLTFYGSFVITDMVGYIYEGLETQSPPDQREPVQLDVNIIKLFLHDCHRVMQYPWNTSRPLIKHEQHPRHVQDPIDLTFIDVDQLRLVTANSTVDYIALSYVWGQTETLQLNTNTLPLLKEPNALRRLRPAPVIQDAIEFTKLIGLKYLWVDCLCIIQDDVTSSSFYIDRMDHVYTYSTLTIVARSGESAMNGLPGIRPNSRRLPVSIRGGFEGLNGLQSLGKQRSFPYDQRAWYV